MQYAVSNFATGLFFGSIIAVVLSSMMVRPKSYHTLPMRIVFLLILIYLLADYIPFEDRYTFIGETSAALVCLYLLRGWWLPSRPLGDFEYPEVVAGPRPVAELNRQPDSRVTLDDPLPIKESEAEGTSPRSPPQFTSLSVEPVHLAGDARVDVRPRNSSSPRSATEAATIASAALPEAGAGAVTEHSPPATTGEGLRSPSSAAEFDSPSGVALERSGHDESPSGAPEAAGAIDEVVTNRLIALLRRGQGPGEAGTIASAAPPVAGAVTEHSPPETSGEDLQSPSSAAEAVATPGGALERSGHDESPPEQPDAAGATDELIDRLIALLGRAKEPVEAATIAPAAPPAAASSNPSSGK
jgi:hypothetical protein